MEYKKEERTEIMELDKSRFDFWYERMLGKLPHHLAPVFPLL